MAFVPRPNMTYVSFVAGVDVRSMQPTGLTPFVMTVSLDVPPSTPLGATLLSLAATAAASAGTKQHSAFVANFLRFKCARGGPSDTALFQMIADIDAQWLPGYLEWMRTATYSVHLQYGWGAATVVHPPLFDYVPLTLYF